MNKRTLSLREKLAWQAVGFVIGAVLFALSGGFIR